MSNETVPATASGLPIQGDDPLLSAINQYLEANLRFGLLPDFQKPEEEDEAIASTYGPSMALIMAWSEAAKTRAGAIAALRLIISDSMCIDSMGVPLLNAAIGYLEANGEDA